MEDIIFETNYEREDEYDPYRPLTEKEEAETRRLLVKYGAEIKKMLGK